MDIESGNGKHMLINYDSNKEYRKNHPDPMFDELTYGDVKNRATQIRKNVTPGSHIFFHTTLKDGQRYITAHYVVSRRPMEGSDARQDKTIRENFRNPHIHPENYPERKLSEDIIIFGDSNSSFNVEKKRIKFDRELAEKIEFEGNKIKFDIIDKNGRALSDAECICSCCKTPRYITKSDARFLFDKMVAENP